MATRSWNRVELIGNLTRDPEVRYTPNGAAVATFSIATNRSYVSDGEKKEEVDFHRCVAWNKLAELCQQLLKKGNRVFVSGRLQNRSWEAEGGQTRNITEIVIEDMLLLTNRSDASSSGEEYSRPAEVSAKVAEAETAPKEEEIPSRQVDEEPKTSKKDEESKKADKPVQEDPGDLDDLPF